MIHLMLGITETAISTPRSERALRMSVQRILCMSILATGCVVDSPYLDENTPYELQGSTGAEIGSSESAEPSQPPSKPERVHLRWHAELTKQFVLTWDPDPTATRYELHEQPTPYERYDALARDLTVSTVSITVPLHLRTEASYIVMACNAAGCTDSNPASVDDTWQGAIGRLAPAAPHSRDQFGRAIATSEDGQLIAVGAPGDDDSTSDSGAVYIYRQSGGIWVQAAKLKAATPTPASRFGTAVALSNDGRTLVIGAHDEDSGEGTVYVYRDEDGRWLLRARFDGQGTFGQSVALSGDGERLAVGGRIEPPVTQSEHGFVYIYQRAAFAWLLNHTIDEPLGHAFGAAVALNHDGSTLVVGSPGTQAACSIDSLAGGGAVFVYRYDDKEASFMPQACFEATDVHGEGQLGTSVTVDDSGTQVAAGAPGQDGNDGGAYVYRQVADAWAIHRLQPPEPLQSQRYGNGVAMSGDGLRLAVAAPLDGDTSATKAGVVHLYEPVAEYWLRVLSTPGSSPRSGNRFGLGLALSRDASALVIGAPDDTGHGSVYLY